MIAQLLANDLDLLEECDALSRDLAVIEQRDGPHPDIDDVWARVDRLRRAVLTRVARLATQDTIH